MGYDWKLAGVNQIETVADIQGFQSEAAVAADGAGITAFRGIVTPAPVLILVVLPQKSVPALVSVPNIHSVVRETERR